MCGQCVCVFVCVRDVQVVPADCVCGWGVCVCVCVRACALRVWCFCVCVLRVWCLCDLCDVFGMCV